MRYVKLALAGSIAALLVGAPSQAALPKLVGTDGPGFTITLKKSGTKVSRLKAGKYAITVKDLSDVHNFHLKGLGVDKRTSVDRIGTTSWVVTLRKGTTYRFVCDPHKSTMRGSFKTF
jgi:Copper binding proteins, plastocyanin/azurin family